MRLARETANSHKYRMMGGGAIAPDPLNSTLGPSKHSEVVDSLLGEMFDDERKKTLGFKTF